MYFFQAVTQAYSEKENLTSHKRSRTSSLLAEAFFSIVFAELTSTRKRDLCPGSKRTVLSMRHGYLTTEPSRDAFRYVGPLNDSRVTANE